MFKAVINSSPLVSDVANDYFQNITGDSFQSDVSFLATLRALVAPRMQEGDSIYVNYRRSNFTADDVRNIGLKKFVRTYIFDDTYVSNGTITIHNCTGNQDGNYATIEAVKSTFCDVYPKWHRLEKVTDFFRKQFYVVCFIDPESKRVFIIADNMDIRKHHYLQCSILAFLPWYFDPEKGVTELEMNLIKSLREKSPNMYEDCIAEIARQYDFKTARVRKLLAGFETRFERQECEKIRGNIQSIDYNIDSLSSQIADYLKRRRDNEIKLLGLETRIAKGNEESEIMEYFLSNDKLHLESVNNSTMTFVATGYLEFFDEEYAKSVIDNDDSYVYLPRGRRCNNYIQHDDMKMLMEAIFLKQSIRIKMCAAYRFEFGVQVAGLKGYHYSSDFREFTPNTHIDAYQCLGNYRQAINQLIKDNNYIMALEQCIASVKSLNFGDSTVMSEFMSRMYGISDYNVNIRCIELPDGRVVEPKEAIEYLKSEVNENEQAD